MEVIKSTGKRWWIIVFFVVVAICVLIAISVVNSMNYHQNNIDFYNFWLAGHLVAEGQSPYNAAQWVAGYPPYVLNITLNPAFLYPLPLALLFAPLGWLSFKAAYIIWVTLIQLMIVISLGILLFFKSNPRTKLFFIPLLAGIILFRPTILTLTQGQLSAFFLCTLAFLVLLWDRGKWFWGGLLLGLLMLKPNLGFLIIALLAVWLLLHQHWNALAGIAASCSFLLIAGIAYRPNWIVEYWHIGSNKLTQTFGGSPTVWGLGWLICHRNSTCMLSFGGLAALLIMSCFLWLVIRHKGLPPATISALAVTVTLLVTPYTWTYDQLLLILPIIMLTLAIDQLGFKLLFIVAIFPAIDVLVVALLFFNVLLQLEILNVFVPFVILGLGAWFFPRIVN